MVEPHVAHAAPAARYASYDREIITWMDLFLTSEGLRRCTLYVFHFVYHVPALRAALRRKEDRARPHVAEPRHARAGHGAAAYRRTRRAAAAVALVTIAVPPPPLCPRVAAPFQQTKVTTTTRHRCVPRPSPPAHLGTARRRRPTRPASSPPRRRASGSRAYHRCPP